MKRLITLITALAMFAGMFGVSAYAYEDVPETMEYHFDLSKAASPSWSQGSQTLSYSNGALEVVSNGGGAFLTQGLSGTEAAFDDYKYVVLKLTDLPENILYFDVMARGTEWYMEAERMKANLRYDDGRDVYLYCDLDAVRDKITAAGGWKGGYVVQMWIMSMPQGTYTFTDVYLSNVSPRPEIAEFSISSDCDTIDTDEGTSTLTPYIAMTNGKEITDFSTVSWAVNSINASAQINEDHTLTLTGKINGSVTVTAYYTYGDTEYSADYTVTVSGQPDRVAAKSIKLMTYGNSIHKHGPNESLGWSGNWGMAASSEDKDYVHQLIKLLGEKYGADNISWVIGDGQGSFESDTSNAYEGQDWTDYLKGVTECAEREKPDIVTIQYGENSHPGETGYSGTEAGYRDAMISIVQMIKKGAPNALVLITTPFWGGGPKEKGAKAAAAKLNIPIANLAQFNTDENKALDGPDEWAGGVKIHPGDIGMENIAKEMYKQLNKFLTGKDNVVYSIPLTGMEITADTNEITTDSGTIQLNVQVQPEGASNDVVWSSDNERVAAVDENGLVTARLDGTAVITAVSKYDSSISDSITITVSGQSLLYTVSYNANTTDTVKDMPPAEDAKKGSLSLAGKYPLRDEYNFAGWSYTKDGEVIDTATITGNTTLYAIWKIADSWTFDRDGYKEGFTIENGFNQYVQNGVFRAIETDYSPVNIMKVYSPKLKLNTDDYSDLEINLQNTAYDDDTVLTLTIHTTDGDFTFEYPVVTAQPTKYTASLDNVTGTITGFDFTPTNMDCTIYIDDIHFIPADPNDSRFFIKKAEPSDGETDVDAQKSAVISFNKKIDISSATVTLNGKKVTSLSVDETGRRLIIDFGGLENLKTYTLKISGIKSSAGAVMEPYEAKFMTKIYEKVIVDEDFSSGTIGAMSVDNMTASVSSENGTYNSAPYSMKASYPTQDWSRVQLDGIRLEVGKVYRLSFYAMKPAGSTTKGINITNSDEGFYIKNFGEPLNTMQYYEAEFTAQYKDTSKNVDGATISAPFLRLPPSADANNVMYFDDVKLVELGTNQRIENSPIDKKGYRDIPVDETLELEYAYKISSVSNVVLTTMQGETLVDSSANASANKIMITLDNNIRYNTYYNLTADAVDIYGRSFKIEIGFITEEQIDYSKIEVLKNGAVLTDISGVSAGDKLTLRITGLRNKSAEEPIELNVIPGICCGGRPAADRYPLKLEAGQTLPEVVFDITVPSLTRKAERLSVLIWSVISDELIKSEISNYYTLN